MFKCWEFFFMLWVIKEDIFKKKLLFSSLFSKAVQCIIQSKEIGSCVHWSEIIPIWLYGKFWNYDFSKLNSFRGAKESKMFVILSLPWYDKSFKVHGTFKKILLWNILLAKTVYILHTSSTYLCVFISMFLLDDYEKTNYLAAIVFSSL